MTMEIVVGDEVVEVEEGDDNLLLYVQKALYASMQIKAWEQQKAIAHAVIDKLQDQRTAAYRTDFGTIKASKRDGRANLELDKLRFAEAEFTRDEVARLIEAANSFSREAIDPGLKGTDPRKWKPTSPLGKLFADCLRLGEPGKGFIVVSVATEAAP